MAAFDKTGLEALTVIDEFMDTGLKAILDKIAAEHHQERKDVIKELVLFYDFLEQESAQEAARQGIVKATEEHTYFNIVGPDMPTYAALLFVGPALAAKANDRRRVGEYIRHHHRKKSYVPSEYELDDKIERWQKATLDNMRQGLARAQTSTKEQYGELWEWGKINWVSNICNSTAYNWLVTIMVLEYRYGIKIDANDEFRRRGLGQHPFSGNYGTNHAADFTGFALTSIGHEKLHCVLGWNTGASDIPHEGADKKIADELMKRKEEMLQRYIGLRR